MGETADLLRELSTIEECEAETVTDAQQRVGEAPEWAEISLKLVRDGKTLTLWLRRHDGELIIEVLHEVLHPNAGGSIRSAIWSELDAAYGQLKEAGNGSDRELRGYARGLAQALAHLENPYAPSLDAVRTTAQERWEARQA